MLLLAASCGGGDDSAIPMQTARPTRLAVLPPELAILNEARVEAVGGPLAFTGAGYSVQSAPLSPTTSSPAAEEHIAMDPNNSCQMVATISDFSIRKGFNTTKFSVSYDFATTWHE